MNSRLKIKVPGLSEKNKIKRLDWEIFIKKKHLNSGNQYTSLRSPSFLAKNLVKIT
jgi:hypothetical protein